MTLTGSATCAVCNRIVFVKDLDPDGRCCFCAKPQITSSSDVGVQKHDLGESPTWGLKRR